MNRDTFYDVIREEYGSLKQGQVEGLELILNFAQQKSTDLWDLSYILATTWHETACTVQPIQEYGSQRYLRSKDYWPYVGRGYVQLTWRSNYEKATEYFREELGIDVDFVKNPEALMDPQNALIILFVGMDEGWFTGKSLDDFIDGIDEDYKEDLREFSNARRIVNGTDDQVEIGKHAIVFEKALKDAGYDPFENLEEDLPDEEVEVPVTTEDVPSKQMTGIAAAILALLIALGTQAEALFNWIRNLI